MCSVIFCEAVAIYGVVVAIILQTKIEAVDPAPNGFYSHKAMFSGYSIFGSGLACGFANLVCGWVIHGQIQNPRPCPLCAAILSFETLCVLFLPPGSVWGLWAAVQHSLTHRTHPCLSRSWW